MNTVVLLVDLVVLAAFAALAVQRVVIGEREAGSAGAGPTTRSDALRVLDMRLAICLGALIIGAATYLFLGLA